MTIDKKKVSIIIPTYKRSDEMLKRAILSTLSQSYENIEIVVVDDNAKPELGEYRKKNISMIKSLNDKRVILVKNKKNMGSAGSRNIGINKSTGSYITFLDDDDVYLENKVLNQYNEMKKNDADYSITDVNLFYTDESVAEKRTRNFIKKTDKDSLFKYHLMYVLAGTDSMMFKKSYLKKIGGFGAKDFGDDFYLFESAINGGGKFAYYPGCDFKAYVHKKEEGLSIGDGKIKGENEVYEYKKKYFGILNRKERRYIKMRHYLVLAYVYKRQRKIFKFLKNGIIAVLISPLDSLKVLVNLKKS